MIFYEAIYLFVNSLIHSFNEQWHQLRTRGCVVWDLEMKESHVSSTGSEFIGFDG